MKKKLFLLLILVCFLSLIACGSKKDDDLVEPVIEEINDNIDQPVVKEVCSDNTFDALKEAYDALSKVNDTVVDYYMNSENIEQNDDLEKALDEAGRYLELVGEIDQSELTEDDAMQIAQSMDEALDGLIMIAEAMGISIK